MSLATLFDRTVDLELTAATGEDARGNETRSTTTLAGVPAYRSQLGAEEDTTDRDQQARTFVYLFPADHVIGEGTHDLTTLTGRDRIVDVDGTFEILGTPIVATSRGRVHHVEARAFLIEG